jgi:hypothetical protein
LTFDLLVDDGHPLSQMATAAQFSIPNFEGAQRDLGEYTPTLPDFMKMFDLSNRFASAR